MTRVNLVPVAELADQHLFAEWRELKMVPRSLARSLASRPAALVLARVPTEFCLNTGHVMFFYDKAGFLRKRYQALTDELLDRGVAINPNHGLDLLGVWDSVNSDFHCDYAPTPMALRLSQERITQRLALRPGWYRHRGRLL